MARDGYVDERIVEMQFDNDQFEREAKVSMNTIEKLKQSLNFGGVEKGIDGISNSIKGLDLSGLGNSISAISDRFSILGIMGDQAIRRVTNGVIDLGLQAVATTKSMSSMANMAAGWQQYAQITSATQKIAANLKPGESMQDVNDVVDILKWLSDETSFRMNSMVDSIGKFTATGQTLRDSADAIMGIGLAAGMAGVNTSMLEHAYTGFSKAMAQGYMSSASWQWIQTAGMNTEEVYKQLIAAGEATGQLKKVSDDTWKNLKGHVVTVGNIVSTFADKWLTDDTILQFAKNFNTAVHSIYDEWERTGETTSSIIERMSDQLDPLGIKALRLSQEAKTFPEVIESVKTAVSGGWATTFQYIFGNYEEARKLWTDLANSLWDIFASSGQARNGILKTWYDLGGRTDLMTGAYNMFDNLVRIADEVKGRFTAKVFGVKTFEDLKENLAGTSDSADELIARYKEINEIIARIKANGDAEAQADTIEEYEEKLEEIESTLSQIDKGRTLFNITKGFKEFSEVVNNLWSTETVLDELRAKLNRLKEVQKDPIMSKGAEENIANAIADTEKQIKMYEALDGVIKVLSKSFEIFINISKFVKSIVRRSFEMLVPIGSQLLRLVQPIGQFIAAIGNLGSAVFNQLGFSKGLRKEFSDLSKVIDDKLGPVIDWLIEKIESLTSWVDKLTEGVKNGTSPISKFFEFVRTQFEAFNSWLGQSMSGMGEDGGLISGIGNFFGRILEILLGVFSQAGPILNKIIDGAQQLFDFFAPLVGSIFGKLGEYFQNFVDMIAKDGDIIGAIQRIADIFVGMKTAFSIDYIADSVSALGGLGDALSGIYYKFRGQQFKSIAESILILAGALLVLSLIDENKLVTGTVVIKVLMNSLIEMSKTMSAISSVKGPGETNNPLMALGMGATKLVKAGFAFIELAAAVLILASAMKKISDIDGDKMILSLLTVSLLMQALGAFAKHTSGLEKINSKGMISMAISLVIMAEAIKMIGRLDPGEAAQGLLVVALLMTFLALFQKYLQTSHGFLKGEKQANGKSIAAAVVGIAASMVILAAAISMLGKIPEEQFAQGLGGVVALLLTLVASLKLLENVKVVGIGAGILIMTVAITALAGVVVMLGLLPWQKALQGVVAVGLLVTILSVALVKINKSLGENSSVRLIGIASAIMILSAALTVLAIPMAVLGSIGIWGVIAALIGFAGALALMWAAGKYLGDMTGTLLKLSGAMALFGIGILAVGAGVTMLAVALTSSVTSIVASLVVIAGGIGSIIAALVNGLAAAAKSIVNGIVIIGKALIDGLQILIPAAADFLLDALLHILVELHGRGLEIIKEVLLIVYGIIDILWDNRVEIINAAIKLAVGLIDGFAQGIINNADTLMAALENLLVSIVYFLVSATETLIESFVPMGETITKYLNFDGIKESLKGYMQDVEMEKLGKDAGENLAGGFKEGSNELEATATEVPAGALAKLSESTSLFKDKGFDFGTELKNGLTEGTEGLPDAFVESLSGSDELFSEKGGEWNTNLLSGLLNGSAGEGEGVEGGSLATAAESIPTSVLTVFSEKDADFQTQGGNWDQSLKAGIDENNSLVVKSSEKVVTDSKKPVDDAKKDWDTAGQNMSLGAAAGILAKKDDVVNAAIQVADEATAAFNNRLKIFSPSRVWEASGEFMTIGAANGLINAIPYIMEAAVAVGDSATDAFEDNGIHIRPVMDLTNVNGTAASIDSMLSASRSAAIAASMDINSQVTQFDQLVDVTNRILGSIQNGSDLYLDDNILAGRINRRLGVL